MKNNTCKKSLAMLLIAMMALSITACSAKTAETEAPATEAPTTEAVTEAPETEAPTTAAATEAATEAAAEETEAEEEKISYEGMSVWEVVQMYGFDEDGRSVLSFSLDGSTCKDCGDYYEIQAVLNHAVTVPKGLKAGDTCTFVINDLTGETEKTTMHDDGSLWTADEDMEYYYWEREGEEEVTLYCYSDDRVDAPFFKGVLQVKKNAITGAAVMNDEHEITFEELSQEGLWFNGVSFDTDGQATRLIFYGD